MSRDLDWDLLALKLAIAAPNMYEMIQTFDRDTDYGTHSTPIHWVDEYVAAQEALGIYPLTGPEGVCLNKAVWRLCDAR